jgi:hypothetical protein
MVREMVREMAVSCSFLAVARRLGIAQAVLEALDYHHRPRAVRESYGAEVDSKLANTLASLSSKLSDLPSMR